MDRATAQSRIDAIDLILSSGVSSVSHGGRAITYDLPALRRERSVLQAFVNRGSGGKNVRVGRRNTAWAD